MHVSRKLQDRVNVKLRDVIAKVEAHYNISVRFPNVIYRKRGTIAGTATPQTWTIDLNSVLLNENVEQFIARTVPHEMAHLVDYQLHPENFESSIDWSRGRRAKRSIHGPTWKRIMIVIGADPSRCHSYDVTNAKVKKRSGRKYTWVCQCGDEMHLGSRRHQKMLVGPARYWMRGHAYCGGYTFKDADGTSVTCLKRDGYQIKRITPDFAIAAETPVVPKSKPAPQRPTGTRTSLKDQAASLYHQANGVRGVFITLCEIDLGMKQSTASTYHHNFKSGKWVV